MFTYDRKHGKIVLFVGSFDGGLETIFLFGAGIKNDFNRVSDFIPFDDMLVGDEDSRFVNAESGTSSPFDNNQGSCFLG